MSDHRIERMSPSSPSRGSGPGGGGAQTLLAGRYQLNKQVDAGGNAVVWRAFDTVDNEWRAVKMLLPELAKRSTLLSRFQREGNTMKDLHHPNIVRVYDAGGDSERAWLVMEFAEGGSVISWVERHGAMPPRLATRVAIELCAGIEYAHQRGVIHRDIKPQNLLVDRNGVCKVTDFGIAQVIQATRVTMTGTVMGTIGYMAPEQHESAKHADERADVYSIAASIYTLVHGEAATHLFMADERDFDGIPEPLAAVIRKGSQYRREARYETVAEMRRAFETVLEQLPQDPPNTPPLVEPTAALPEVAYNQVPPPIESDSLEPMVPELRVPLIDKTPSSIIPRDSLTGSNRIRRPRIKNRDEIESQYRIRIAALAVGIFAVAGFLLLFATALFGKVELESAENSAQIASDALRAQLNVETRLLDLKLQRMSELEAHFEEIRLHWAEQSPDDRISDTIALHDTIKAEYGDLLSSGNPDIWRREIMELEQANTRLERSLSEYQGRIRDLEEVKASWLGMLGGCLPW